MTRIPSPSFVLPTMLLAIAAVLGSAPLRSSEVHWLRTDAACAEPAPSEETMLLTCGAAGRFYLNTEPNPPIIACATEAAGTEMAAFYARSNVGPMGSCFRRRGGPWVAVADVRGLRSKNIGFTVLESADGLLDVGLLDLAAVHDRMPPRVGMPSDAHLLTVLCDLAQSLDDGTDEPPVALVLPFGRYLEAMPECDLDEASLTCQIDRLLAHLHNAHGTLAIAAAGDHRATTFPAAAGHALAVAAIDQGRFLLSNIAEPSWESPQQTAAVMTGLGVLLDLNRANGLWAPPSGSPVAAGLFAGWFAATVVRGWQPPEPFPFDASWAPWPAAEGFLLSLDNAPLAASASTGADLLVRRALGLVETGEDPTLSNAETVLVHTDTPLALPGDTLPSIVASLQDEWPPLPDVLPCVPCASVRPPGPPPTNPGDLGTSSTETLIIDLSLSGSVGGFYELTELALRLGETVYRLDGGNDVELLSALSEGTATAIAIANLDLTSLSANGESVGLVFLMTYNGAPFWHATPLVLRAGG